MFSSNTSQVSDDKLWVEEVFQTWLYQGNGSTQTITNGIDLAGKGGMVWVKQRNSAQSHRLYDTSRGVSQMIASNTTSAQANTSGFGVTSFSSSGFTLVDDASNYGVNFSGNTYASWTFREAPKFFKIFTYVGDGTGLRAIPLPAGWTGANTGAIIVKNVSAAEDWYYLRNGSSQVLFLNKTDAQTQIEGSGWGLSGDYFFIGSSPSNYGNKSGNTYVAYLFAHDATSDGIIQCGSFTTDGSGNATVNLGWEPQFFILKSANAAENWQIIDNMRGWSQTGFGPLYPNLSNAEGSLSGNLAFPTATGCQFNSKTASTTYIYIAIRRGPMRTPTTGTSVFAPVTYSGNGSTNNLTTNFPVDSLWIKARAYNPYVSDPFDRLRGGTKALSFLNTDAEATDINYIGGIAFDSNTVAQVYGGASGSDSINYSGKNFASWAFRRAPSFFDEVCYTGNFTANRNINHNLGVVPELIIMKSRSAAYDWNVYHTFTGSGHSYAFLNSTSAGGSATYAGYGENAPTSTTFSVGADSGTNASGGTYVAYLFASCPGVSKVGSYTGNGSSQTINCGFSGGARFVLIKRTDSTGNWLVGDTARGLVAGNDPLLYLNSTAAEITTLDWLDTDSSGFVVNQDTTANANVNGATYIYLAVA